VHSSFVSEENNNNFRREGNIMSNSKLAALKDRFKKSTETGGGQGQNNYYPFWNMKEGEQAIVRFLPDSNPDNPLMFLSEKLMHNLTVNGEKKSVPCMKMYGKECPICKVSSAYYKQDDKANGKLYWRKKQYLAQVLVIEDPLPADKETGETHEGKIRYVALGNKLYDAISDAFESGDLDEVPFDYEEGTNFIIKKTKQGEYADYSRSKFQKNPTALDAETVAHIEKSLIDVSSLLPKEPELAKVEAMLEAALSGKSFVEGETKGKSGDDDTPTTVVKSAKDAAKASTTKKAEPAAAKDEPAGEEFGEDDAERILEEIRKRKRAAAPAAAKAE
jgi:hypothetical protein